VYKQRPTFRARDPEDYEKISCVVIGINPGKLEKGEPEYNECKKKNDETIYQKQVKYFKDHISPKITNLRLGLVEPWVSILAAGLKFNVA
jgi:hypothetical protein